MVIERFPDVSDADENGLLAIGGDLEVGSLLLAYRSGIFPWPYSSRYPAWFAPPQRALIMLDEFHVSNNLKKVRRRANYEFAVNRRFEEVISACAELANRGKQRSTWITPAMIKAYIQLHKAGYAHSIECYLGSRLIGGLYGVAIGGMFAGESMFYREENGSKLALWFLVEELRKNGAKWIDVQVLSPFLESVGAKLVPRTVFMKLLQQELESETELFSNWNLAINRKFES